MSPSVEGPLAARVADRYGNILWATPALMKIFSIDSYSGANVFDFYESAASKSAHYAQWKRNAEIPLTHGIDHSTADTANGPVSFVKKWRKIYDHHGEYAFGYATYRIVNVWGGVTINRLTGG